MNINQYIGICDYHGLGYSKGIVSAQLAERPYYGEEIRDKEYYAEKYYERFMSIWSMIEHGQLKFDSKGEKDEAWYAMLEAMNRYKKRRDYFHDKKHSG